VNFSNKLDAFMRITGTTNAALGQYLNVDPSLISRWRMGKRIIKPSSHYLPMIADFILECRITEYQQNELLKIGMPGSPLHDQQEKREILSKWLGAEPVHSYQSPQPQSNDLGAVMSKISALDSVFNTMGPQMSAGLLKNLPPLEFPQGESCMLEAFSGIQGKRQAVIRIMNTLISQETPRELWCFSDEDIFWLMGDRVFYLRWAELMKLAIAKGHRIKIIHVLNRAPVEIVSAIEQWSPLHLTGMIDSYYMPKYIARNVKQSIWVIPGVLTSFAITGKTSGIADCTYVTQCPSVVADMEQLYQGLLSESKRYFKLYKTPKLQELPSALLEVEKTHTNTILFKDALSDITMPENVLYRLTQRIGMSQEEAAACIEYHSNCVKAFKQNAAIFDTIHILAVKNLSELLGANMLYLGCGKGEAFLYEPIDLYEHLQSTVQFLKTYDKYHLYIASKEEAGFGSNISFMAKDGFGAILSKWDEQGKNPVILLTEEPISSTVFYSILKNTINIIPDEQKTKSNIIARLEAYAYTLLD